MDTQQSLAFIFERGMSKAAFYAHFGGCFGEFEGRKYVCADESEYAMSEREDAFHIELHAAISLEKQCEVICCLIAAGKMKVFSCTCLSESPVLLGVVHEYAFKGSARHEVLFSKKRKLRDVETSPRGCIIFNSLCSKGVISP